MSGILLRSPFRSIASAVIALPGDPATGHARRAPTLSLALSGGIHAAALALFLIASARSGGEDLLARPIRVVLSPPIDVLTLEPLRLDSGSSGRAADRGTPEPVPRQALPEDRDFDIVTPSLPIDGTKPVGGPSAGRNGGGSEPALVAGGGAEPGDSDVPSLYEDPPVPIVAPEPHYPEWAREAGIEGRVVVEALVARDGRVLNVRVKEGDRNLSEEAVKAVRAWKFRPARWNGRPVAAWVAIPILFRLH
ncbi:MAG TPA: energy transducer TonB [Candidatus Eisenbacteria bacterium]|nr:energy transducer TonB [Candidatus Eisenbacteria bacterium]